MISNNFEVTYDMITRNIKKYIQVENVEDGLLEDVETVITSYKSDEPLDDPIIWLYKETTELDTTLNKGKASIVNNLYHSTTYNFVAVCYDEDIGTAETLAENLATRIGLAIAKNYNLVKDEETDPDNIFQAVRFKSLIPVDMDIRGKAEKLPACKLQLDFIYRVNWGRCRQR